MLYTFVPEQIQLSVQQAPGEAREITELKASIPTLVGVRVKLPVILGFLQSAKSILILDVLKHLGFPRLSVSCCCPKRKLSKNT